MKYHIDITVSPRNGEEPKNMLHRIAEKLREIAESIEDGCTQEQSTFPHLSHYVAFDDHKEEA